MSVGTDVSMKSHTELPQSISHQRQAEAAKTARLRALREAKEAADKETALREAAAKPIKPKRRPAGSTTAATEADRSEPTDGSARE